MILRPTTGYPEEYRQALHASEFDVRIIKARHRDAYGLQTRGVISGTDLAFMFAVLLEDVPTDDAADTLELARNMLLGREMLHQERSAAHG